VKRAILLRVCADKNPEEIDITPAMIKGRVGELWELQRIVDSATLVERVFLAMRKSKDATFLVPRICSKQTYPGRFRSAQKREWSQQLI